MILDAQYLMDVILRTEEAVPQDNSDYKSLIGIVSGNKTYIENASLEDIIYLMNNFGEILDRKYQEKYPQIKMESLQKCEKMTRRAI